MTLFVGRFVCVVGFACCVLLFVLLMYTFSDMFMCCLLLLLC